ncbi:MAG: EI24 domain-containing protein [Paracoccaceae bacterium]
MLSDFWKALTQLGDRRFLKVAAWGVLLCLGLLAAAYAIFLWLIQSLTPDTLTLPVIGAVHGLHTFLGWGSAVLMLGLSVFLMVPVASAFSGLFLEEVVEAVEDRHYPQAPSVPRLSLGESLRDSVNFMGVLIAVNLLALLVYIFTGPFVPLAFWALNGFLLGREYFTLVAMRRLGREGARDLRQRYFWQVWLAGTLMAVPLSVPVINLLVPVLGVASYTHMFHRLARS